MCLLFRSLAVVGLGLVREIPYVMNSVVSAATDKLSMKLQTDDNHINSESLWNAENTKKCDKETLIVYSMRRKT